jgi:hypothetical protein
MSREQKLIDIMFEVAQASYHWNRDKDGITRYLNEGERENHMEWVAEQLRLCGFDTQQMGMSWGVLKK